MINREDMLELTRRMTPSRTCFDRIAGGYMDQEGFLDGSFNTNFLKLSHKEMKEKLELAKTIPYAKENEELREYPFSIKNNKQRNIYQILNGMKESGLRNDAVLEGFYEAVAEVYQTESDYAVFLFHGRYDVPVKASDKEWLEGSEEVYDFIIGTICPLVEEYEAESPVFGFLFPFFSDRSSDMEHIALFQAKGSPSQERLLEDIFCC